MSRYSLEQQKMFFLVLSVTIITFLVLLINLSFKVVVVYGFIFSINSVLCSIIAALYLWVLQTSSFKEQRHLLNVSLMALYLFSIGAYILIHLPASDYMIDKPVYQLIFDEVPKKFFATTISFALAFYLPHILLNYYLKEKFLLPKQSVLRAIFSGILFFCIDFYLLFSDPYTISFKQIFIDSLMVVAFLLLMLGVVYLCFVVDDKVQSTSENLKTTSSADYPLYYYLVCSVVAVMLVCFAFEYRIVAVYKEMLLTASCVFFPFIMMTSTVVNEGWGWQAHWRLIILLTVAQVIFDLCFMTIVAMPSPAVFNLSDHYNYIVPRKLPAEAFSLWISLLVNSLLLCYFRYSRWCLQRPLRILAANISASTVLCALDYSLLFGGIYPYQQILNLAVYAWYYKLLAAVILLPLMLRWCNTLDKKRANLSLPVFSNP